MSPDMHDDVQAALAAEALDALSPAEREGLMAHVAECPECAAALAELREAAAALAHLPPVRAQDPARRERVRARLLARAAADRGAGNGLGAGDGLAAAPGPVVERPAVVAPTLPPLRVEDPGIIPLDAPREARGRAARPSRAGWLAAAASVALLLGVGAWALSLRGRVDALDARLAAAESDRADLREALGQREATLRELVSERTRVIDLSAAGPQAPAGRMFWNTATNAWTFYAHNLPQLPAGREYQLWIVTPSQKIPGGTFRPDARGDASHQATYNVPREQVRAVAITEEPTGGVPVATGPIVLVGALASTE